VGTLFSDYFTAHLYIYWYKTGEENYKMRTDWDPQFQKDVTNNQNDVRVNNTLQLTIHFGDALNIAGLILGIYLLKKLVCARKQPSEFSPETTSKGQPAELFYYEPAPTSKYSIH
jgi:hypothetical protein